MSTSLVSKDDLVERALRRALAASDVAQATQQLQAELDAQTRREVTDVFVDVVTGP
ncbi:hypothetical protein QRO11_09785 [Paracidovorax citrulli]|uniref:Uncharacterized protein n=1 Tax=Paracidovorax citrulli TaxID=80869 RepID=A0ABY9AWP8_PARCI|nr:MULTISPECIES: hypothetical protein [Paracidovorax]MVT28868.1 hypothetical protein [Paracidovorax citrulli]MVT36540.1 hypothetical protein [Paracidovorax citrulli]PVY62846.1 hypothetical protein C8E08_0109 [Paracidovorax citrulli]QCX13018.1 hypothetical protein APS58_4331 [Paracidovorax citrulli]REG68169.1 hypothetical protein C8E07_1269 [Paracidovorax citrulli]